MSKQNILLPRNISVLNCPSCHNVGTLHNSKTKTAKEGFLKNIFWWGYFRCWECNWRGLMLKKTLTKKSFKFILFYILLAICSSYLVLIILRSVTG